MSCSLPSAPTPAAHRGAVRPLAALLGVTRDHVALGDLRCVRDELGRVLAHPVVRQPDRLVGSLFVVEDTQGSHRALTSVDPVVRDEAVDVLELWDEALADETSRFGIVGDALVSPYGCIHRPLLCSWSIGPPRN